jgi:hypothetical protein
MYLMKPTLIIRFLFLFLFSTSVFGDSYINTGSILLERCNEAMNMIKGEMSLTIEGAYCIAYIDGFLDADKLYVGLNEELYNSNLNWKLCIPPSVTIEQVIRIVVKFLEENPEQLHESYDLLTMLALTKSVSRQSI